MNQANEEMRVTRRQAVAVVMAFVVLATSAVLGAFQLDRFNRDRISDIAVTVAHTDWQACRVRVEAAILLRELADGQYQLLVNEGVTEEVARRRLSEQVERISALDSDVTDCGPDPLEAGDG